MVKKYLKQKLYCFNLSILVFFLIVAGIVFSSLYGFYTTTITEKRQDLEAVVHAHRSLIEEIYRATGTTKRTINVLKHAHFNMGSAKPKGEFVLGYKDNDKIKLVIWNSDKLFVEEKVFPVSENIAMPLQKALFGKSGQMNGYDYRGEKVIAAYSFIDSLGMGLVAKIDLWHIQKIFLDC